MGYVYDEENDILLIKLSDEKPDFEDQRNKIMSSAELCSRMEWGLSTVILN